MKVTKYLLIGLFVCITSFVHADTTTYQNHSVGMDRIMEKDALESFKTEYMREPDYKAFAQSDSGKWAWRSGRTSIEHARTNALVFCQTNNKRYEEQYPCKIINVNGDWVVD